MNTWRWAVAFAVASAAPAAAANPDDAALNRLYEAVAAGVAANSAEAIVAAFADDAVVLDPRPNPPAVGAAFRDGIGRMAAKLKADGVKVTSEYRIERRLVAGDLAVDTGYRRLAFVPAAGGAAPSVQYHKFLVVARRRRDGSWKILRDASLPASEAAWAGAVRSDGLKYDGGAGRLRPARADSSGLRSARGEPRRLGLGAVGVAALGSRGHRIPGGGGAKAAVLDVGQGRRLGVGAGLAGAGAVEIELAGHGGRFPGEDAPD
jgi:uncharacterized protein (TIGR02246 family)